MEAPIVICRSATAFLRLGYVTGYQCRVCGAELQVSPVGVDQIAAGGIPTCAPCAGFPESPPRDEAAARRRRNAV